MPRMLSSREQSPTAVTSWHAHAQQHDRRSMSRAAAPRLSSHDHAIQSQRSENKRTHRNTTRNEGHNRRKKAPQQKRSTKPLKRPGQLAPVGAASPAGATRRSPHPAIPGRSAIPWTSGDRLSRLDRGDCVSMQPDGDPLYPAANPREMRGVTPPHPRGAGSKTRSGKRRIATDPRQTAGPFQG